MALSNPNMRDTLGPSYIGIRTPHLEIQNQTSINSNC
jgi:hypothetical protein